MSLNHSASLKSWISIKSLKKEAELAYLYSDQLNEYIQEPFSPQSEPSISIEPKSNTETNSSTNVPSGQSTYWQSELNNVTNLSCAGHEIHKKDTKFSKLINRYENLTAALKLEISTLRPKLIESQKKVRNLQSLLSHTQKTYFLQIQDLKIKHEQKVLKMQKDFESMLKSQSTACARPTNARLPRINQQILLETQKSALKPDSLRTRNNSVPALLHN